MKFTLAFLILASTAILVASMQSSDTGSSGAPPSGAEWRVIKDDITGKPVLIRVPRIGVPRIHGIDENTGREFIRLSDAGLKLTPKEFGAILARWESAKWKCLQFPDAKLDRKTIAAEWKCTPDEFRAINVEWRDTRDFGSLTEVDYRNLASILFQDNGTDMVKILAAQRICEVIDDPKTIRDKIFAAERSKIEKAVLHAGSLSLKSFD